MRQATQHIASFIKSRLPEDRKESNWGLLADQFPWYPLSNVLRAAANPQDEILRQKAALYVADTLRLHWLLDIQEDQVDQNELSEVAPVSTKKTGATQVERDTEMEVQPSDAGSESAPIPEEADFVKSDESLSPEEITSASPPIDIADGTTDYPDIDLTEPDAAEAADIEHLHHAEEPSYVNDFEKGPGAVDEEPPADEWALATALTEDSPQEDQDFDVLSPEEQTSETEPLSLIDEAVAVAGAYENEVAENAGDDQKAFSELESEALSEPEKTFTREAAIGVQEDETRLPAFDLKGLKEAMQAPIAADAKLEIDAIHTVDYFASQGIKVEKTVDGKPPTPLDNQVKSFTEWLKTMKKLSYQPATTYYDPLVETKAKASLKNKDVITEAMAEVWEKQGNWEKAADIYQKLMLLHPEKIPFFASRLKDLKEKQ